MTKTRFRIAVVGSLALGVMGSAAAFIGQSGMPDPLRAYVEQRGNAELTALDWTVLALGVAIVIGYFVSLIGMFQFRRSSRPLSVVTYVASLLLVPLMGPTVEPGAATALNSASSMLSGAVLALAYFSPAAGWFEAPRSPDVR